MQPRIFLAEDDDSYRMIVQIILQRKGYEVVTAANFTEAAETLELFTPDLCIFDVMMPDGTGIELCRRVRSQSHTREVPVIIFSANNDPHTIRESEKAGANRYLFKIDLHTKLTNAVQTLLSASPHRLV